MFAETHLNRLSFSWLLIAQGFLLLPQLIRFPALFIAPWLLCTVWAFAVFQGKIRWPNAWVKCALIIISMTLLLIQGLPWYSTEVMVCMLLLAYLLKLLELKNHRDSLIMAYLSYFAIVGQLLLSQSLWSGLYLFIALTLATTFLIAAHMGGQPRPFLLPLKTAMKMLAVSLPVMLMAFLIFPRLEPFWSVPMIQGQAKTGMSATMAPGMMSELAQSDALVFRARFITDVPAMHQLYWRALILTQFDGRQWSALDERKYNKVILDDVIKKPNAVSIDYQLTLEPSYKNWLFSLGQVIHADQPLNYLRDATVQSKEAIQTRQQLNFHALMNAGRDAQIYRYHRKAALQLPVGFNVKTLSFAKDLYAKSDSNEDYIERILQHFSLQPFYYTLSPPLLGRNYIDDFLFSTRRGFCEHYASAFVVLMRAVGIPARVVTGYQGGDINPYEQHVTVRQLDAHAWAEVWLPKKGWVHQDPTAAVAPERIEKGSAQSLQKEDKFLSRSPLSSKHFQSLSWLLSMSYRYDQLNALWHRNVLNYSGDTQQNVLKRLLGEVSMRSVLIFTLTFFMICALLVSAFFLLAYRPKKASQVTLMYRRFLRKAAKGGLVKSVGEGPLDFKQRCIIKWPHQQEQIVLIISYYLQLQYDTGLDKQQQALLFKAFSASIKALKCH